MNPILSIIIPTFNSRLSLRRTLQSIINQKWDKFEIIVIDGGSLDGTIEIITNRDYDKKISYWVSEPDNGIYQAMNKGIKQAKGEWIYFLGSDDRFCNDEVLMNLSLENITNDVDLIYTNTIYVNNNGDFVINKQEPKKISSYFLFTNNICHQGLIARKRLFLEIGYFDESLKIKSDHDFQLKCYFNNKKFEYKNIFLSEYCIEGFSGNNIKKLRKELILMTSRYYPSFIVYLRKLWWKIKKIEYESFVY